MRPRVSILLPAWNAESTLGAALRSVVRQTFADWECVVVDDGSTDGTAVVAEAAATRDARIHVVRLPHAGLVGTLQAGLANCRGTLVARMDADDVMRRTRLARQVEALDRDPTLVGVGAHVRVFPRGGLTDGLRAYEDWLRSIDSAARVATDAYVESPLAHPTLLVRRSVLAEFGYRDCGWPEDYDLLLRILRAGHRLGVVPERLVGWRDHPGRLTRTGAAYALDRITACKASHLAAGFLESHSAYILWGHGGTGRALKRALAVHDKHPAYVVEVHPGRIGNRIDGVPVVPHTAIPTLPALPLLASVAGAEPRRQIREALVAMGRRETIDFLCCA